MQGLRQLEVEQTERFVCVVEAICYAYPGLYRAEKIRAPQPNFSRTSKTANQRPVALKPNQKGYSLNIPSSAGRDGYSIEEAVARLYVFLSAVRKPMYIRVAVDAINRELVVCVWDDECEELEEVTIKDEVMVAVNSK